FALACGSREGEVPQSSAARLKVDALTQPGQYSSASCEGQPISQACTDRSQHSALRTAGAHENVIVWNGVCADYSGRASNAYAFSRINQPASAEYQVQGKPLFTYLVSIDCT